MLEIPSYIRIKQKYQEPADFLGLFILIVFIILLVYFSYYKITIGYRWMFPRDKDSGGFFTSIPHYGRDELTLNYPIERTKVHSEYTFSITGFVYITNWKYRFFENKLLFKLGNPLIDIYLNEIDNRLTFAIATREGTQQFSIKNVDINRWFHFGLVINDLQVELYYNGKLYESFLLKQLSKNVNDSIEVCTNGGFEGLLYDISIFLKSLEYKDIAKLSQKKVPINEKYFKS